MQQPDLFPPASHNIDPVSSYEAEERVTKSGKRNHRQEVAYAILNIYPESTAAELHRRYEKRQRLLKQKAKLDVLDFRRALSDMKGKKVERRPECRICDVAKTKAAVWYIK